MEKMITFLILFSIQLCAGIGIGKSAVGALPVELTSFTASQNGKNIVLRWITATEVNNYGFEIERSQKTEVPAHDGTGGSQNPPAAEKWETVGFVKGSGNSNSPKEYSFTDLLNLSLKLSYRLKQIDNNGAFKYTKAINAGSGLLNYALEQNYPNPFNPTTIISFQLPVESNVVLKLYDAIGNEVAVLINENKQAGYHNYRLSANNYQLSAGVYYYRIEAGEYAETKKMLLLK